MTCLKTDRRTFMLQAVAGATALTAGPLRAQTPGQTQVVGVHRRGVGAARVTALLDGFIPIDPSTLTGAEPETVATLLERAFLESGPVDTSINAYVIESAGRVVLVDGGTIFGPDGGAAFGPTTGKLMDAFTLAGFAPEQVDAIFCTHLHPDHIGLFLTPGAPRFENAEFFLHSAEQAFWSDPGNFAAADEQVKGFAAAAQGALEVYQDRLRPLEDGGAVAPGLELMHLPGHTPGHSGLMVSSGDDAMLVWGDIVHVGVAQFAQPDWTIGFDVDQPLAAETRKKVLDMAAANRLEIAGAHIDFPSFGHVETAGEGYRFTPSRWDHEV